MSSENLIVIMAKQPIVGKTKTRLHPPLSHSEAAALYEALLKDTIHLVSRIDSCQMGIATSPPGSENYFKTITPRNTLLFPVEGETIGICLLKTITWGLNAGFRKVLAINSDGPSLPADYLLQAIRILKANDIVFGPGHDGGYYLVGMKEVYPLIFQGIPWSTPQVMATTRQRVSTQNLSAGYTPGWYDIDTQSDLERLIVELRSLPSSALPHTRYFLSANKVLDAAS